MPYVAAPFEHAIQLDAMYVQNARLQGIKDTLIAKAHRNVTLKKGAVLAFMTGQFVTLGEREEVFTMLLLSKAGTFIFLLGCDTGPCVRVLCSQS